MPTIKNKGQLHPDISLPITFKASLAQGPGLALCFCACNLQLQPLTSGHSREMKQEGTSCLKFGSIEVGGLGPYRNVSKTFQLFNSRSWVSGVGVRNKTLSYESQPLRQKSGDGMDRLQHYAVGFGGVTQKELASKLAPCFLQKDFTTNTLQNYIYQLLAAIS